MKNNNSNFQAKITFSEFNDNLDDDLFDEDFENIQCVIMDYMCDNDITEFNIKSTTVPTKTPDGVECTGYNFYVSKTYKSGETENLEMECD